MWLAVPVAVLEAKAGRTALGRKKGAGLVGKGKEGGEQTKAGVRLCVFV